MKIMDGKIVVGEDEAVDEYEIERMTVEIGEDMTNVIGVARCTRITIESDAPWEINSEAENLLYNEFAGTEYNDADGSGECREQVRKDISDRTGVDISRIEVE